MKLSEELKHWGYHSNISDEGKKQHLEMSTKTEALEITTLAAIEALHKLEYDAVDNYLHSLMNILGVSY